MSVQVEVRKKFSATGRLAAVTVKVVRDLEVLAEATDEGVYSEEDDEFSAPDEKAAARAALEQMQRNLADARAQLRFVTGGV